MPLKAPELDGHPGLRRVLVAGRDFGRRAAWPVGSVVATRSVRHVALTYDDGPEPGGTEPVLAALAEAGVHATFFVLMTRVRRYPALLAEVVAAGHEVGLHGVDHRPLPEFTPTQARRRCIDGRAELEDAIGAAVRWFRPPYGRLTMAGWGAVRTAGLMPVLWGPSSADSIDVPDAERVAQASADVSAGAILLCHDGFAGPQDGVDDGPPPELDRGALAARIITNYRAAGLEPGSLGEAALGARVHRKAIFVG